MARTPLSQLPFLGGIFSMFNVTREKPTDPLPARLPPTTLARQVCELPEGCLIVIPGTENRLTTADLRRTADLTEEHAVINQWAMDDDEVIRSLLCHDAHFRLLAARPDTPSEIDIQLFRFPFKAPNQERLMAEFALRLIPREGQITGVKGLARHITGLSDYGDHFLVSIDGGETRYFIYKQPTDLHGLEPIGPREGFRDHVPFNIVIKGSADF